MITLLYDSTFEGFLTAVFEAYDRRLPEYRIRKAENYTKEMFGEELVIDSNKQRSERVWKGLQQRITSKGLDYIYCASLSELPHAEDTITRFIQHIFSNQQNVEADFSNPYVLEIARINKMVHRERHRMKAFIRFQLTKDDLYYAAIEPDFNVIPLIIPHFKNRYANQRWLIYDIRRQYGIYYDLHTVETITLDFAEGNKAQDITLVLDEKETFYQRLWQDYFKSVNIASRRNMPLHIKHVPRRYWRLLTEKG
jgi:probable DNA metabolism protein